MKLNNVQRNSRLITHALTLTMCAAIAAPAVAQMQIPNPLVQPAPRKPVGQKDELKDPLPPMSGQQGAARIQDMGMPPQYGAPMGSASQGAVTRTPFSEVRERLAPFYVSAIVGDRAILRRGVQTPQSNVLGQGPMQQMGPIPITGMAGNNTAAAPKPTYSQTETMTVTDGEPIDFIGDGITLTPKVTSSRVSIYYSDDGSSPRKASKRQVVFIGQVESTTASIPVPIVLEKPDPTYKQKVSVETKSRSSGSTSNSGQNSGNSPFGSQPQPNMNQ